MVNAKMFAAIGAIFDADPEQLGTLDQNHTYRDVKKKVSSCTVHPTEQQRWVASMLGFRTARRNRDRLKPVHVGLLQGLIDTLLTCGSAPAGSA